MARKFKDPEVQAAYNQMSAAPPEIRGGIANAYWKGREPPAAKSGFPRGTASYGAWAAGVDAAKS